MNPFRLTLERIVPFYKRKNARKANTMYIALKRNIHLTLCFIQEKSLCKNKYYGKYKVF